MLRMMSTTHAARSGQPVPLPFRDSCGRPSREENLGFQGEGTPGHQCRLVFLQQSPLACGRLEVTNYVFFSTCFIFSKLLSFQSLMTVGSGSLNSCQDSYIQKSQKLFNVTLSLSQIFSDVSKVKFNQTLPDTQSQKRACQMRPPGKARQRGCGAGLFSRAHAHHPWGEVEESMSLQNEKALYFFCFHISKKLLCANDTSMLGNMYMCAMAYGESRMALRASLSFHHGFWESNLDFQTCMACTFYRLSHLSGLPLIFETKQREGVGENYSESQAIVLRIWEMQTWLYDPCLQ